MRRDPLEAQELSYRRGEEVPIEVTVYASQYANGADLNYRFQIFGSNSAETIYVNETGSGTVADLKITVTISTTNTALTPVTEELDPDYHNFLMWDTDLDRAIAFGYVFVREGLRS